MAGGVKILRPSLSKRFCEAADEERGIGPGVDCEALKFCTSCGLGGFVGSVLLALTRALAAFGSWWLIQVSSQDKERKA